MKDLFAVMAATDYLVDYKLSGYTSIRQKQNQEGSKKHKAIEKPSY